MRTIEYIFCFIKINWILQFNLFKNKLEFGIIFFTVLFNINEHTKLIDFFCLNRIFCMKF